MKQNIKMLTVYDIAFLGHKHKINNHYLQKVISQFGLDGHVYNHTWPKIMTNYNFIEIFFFKKI